MYQYPLECGHRFRSLTPSYPLDLFGSTEFEDTEDQGAHWFFCTPCDKYRVVEASKLVTIRPRATVRRAWGEPELIRLTDQAIMKDRVARMLSRNVGFSARRIADELGVPPRFVTYVATALGIDSEQL